MVAHRGFVGNIDRKLKRLLLSQPLTVIPSIDGFTGSDAILVTQKRRDPLPEGYRKQLVIKTSGAFDPAAGEVSFPFTLHPNSYDARDDLGLDAYRAITKRWRLFFSGACHSRYYDTSWIREHFGKVPRSTVVEILDLEFAGDRTLRLDADAELEAIMARQFEGFVLGEVTDATTPIPSHRWLEALARAVVFIAAPGVSYPVCHNIIEAMAVGTVPLTEYPEQFDPPLSDGENCLVYRGEDGLASRAREIVQAPAESLAALSRGAVEYYDRHLSPTGFVGRIEADPRSTLTVHLKSYEWPRKAKSDA
jgi:hypothetical protein